MSEKKTPWNEGVEFASEMHEEIIMHHTINLIAVAIDKGFTDEEIANFLDISVEEIEEKFNWYRRFMWDKEGKS